MKKLPFRILSTVALLTYACMSLARVNPITVTFLNGTTDFTTGSNGTAYYVVAVNPDVVPPNVPLTFSLTNPGNSRGLTAIQQLSGASPCSDTDTLCGNRFSLSAGQRCCLVFSLASSTAGTYSLRPTISTSPPAYPAQAPSAVPINVKAISNATSLSTSPSTLILSVNNTGLNAALTGNPRQITVTNTGSNTATGLEITQPSWPSGTSVTSTTCSTTLAPGASCTITITPGMNTTSNCTEGIAPTPGTVTISANNAASVQSNVVVVSYACIVEGGYVFAVDDTTPLTGSTGGKVAEPTDNPGAPNGIVWDSSVGCTTAPYNNCYIVGSDSQSNGTNLPNPPPGGNTYLIHLNLSTTHGENPATYAAGLCTLLSDGWYLPAACEQGYGANFSGVDCGTSSAPTLQNMQSNLIDNTGGVDVAGLTTGGTQGNYWASTEYPTLPGLGALHFIFSTDTNTTIQGFDLKGNPPRGVRCVKMF